MSLVYKTVFIHIFFVPFVTVAIKTLPVGIVIKVDNLSTSIDFIMLEAALN